VRSADLLVPAGCLLQECFVDESAGFVACGDYFVAAKVEGAAVSGASAAESTLRLVA